jgi:hypothetical protein
MADPESKTFKTLKFFWMAEPESKTFKTLKFFWMAEPESNLIRTFEKIKFFWMAEPESKTFKTLKFFWMAEPGHPHEVGVLNNRHPAAGTHKPLRKKLEYRRVYPKMDMNARGKRLLIF